MDTSPLIAVAVITSGDSSHFIRTSQQWIAEGFVPGVTLFFCGPRQRLLAQGIEVAGVIEYVDPPYYRNNFHINDKKLTACNAIDAKYIYLVHDRFLPKSGFLDALTQALADGSIDFGAVDVDNQDGTPALRELRVRRAAALTDIESALEPLGRLTCAATDPDASIHIAVNGGQFFLRKSIAKHLGRPMRWMEMEDDVLSHDLRSARGRWINECGLITLMPRLAPDFDYSDCNRLKYVANRAICNTLAAITGSISVGQRLGRSQLERYLSGECLLIDPLHKLSSSDVLPLSLEKLMTRARIASSGLSLTNVEKHRLGWKITGHKGNR